MHYLALLERKTGALEQAALLEGWQLPEEFAHLRRLLQTRIGKAGSRKYIQVLRLLEDFRLEEVRATVGDAMRLGTISFDAVKHLLLCRIEQRPRTLGNISRGDPPMASLAHLHCSKTTLGAAVEAFFADRDLAPSTRRAYRATYGSLLQAFGAEMPVTALTPVQLRRWLSRRWGKAAAATWNARTHRVPGSYRLLPAPGLARARPGHVAGAASHAAG